MHGELYVGDATRFPLVDVANTDILELTRFEQFEYVVHATMDAQHAKYSPLLNAGIQVEFVMPTRDKKRCGFSSMASATAFGVRYTSHSTLQSSRYCSNSTSNSMGADVSAYT